MFAKEILLYGFRARRGRVGGRVSSCQIVGPNRKGLMERERGAVYTCEASAMRAGRRSERDARRPQKSSARRTYGDRDAVQQGLL